MDPPPKLIYMRYYKLDENVIEDVEDKFCPKCMGGFIGRFMSNEIYVALDMHTGHYYHPKCFHLHFIKSAKLKTFRPITELTANETDSPDMQEM